MKTLNETIAALGKNSGMSIIVHSHLRWDFVWQRPQQTHSRLAKHFPVLFVEEPIYIDEGDGHLQLSSPHSNITRAIPHISSTLRGNYDASIIAVRALLKETLTSDKTLASQFQKPIQWFYTPMPAPAMLGHFKDRGVVYDCMDELAQFRGAPQDISAREKTLMSKADILFTGGRKLYESKSRYHSNVHFFGCGVDVAHYAKAQSKATALPQDVANLRGKTAGYIGVIDERLDYDLIAKLAESDPELDVIMVGPVVKVDPASLPKNANIHWLGQRDYKQLPAYIKSFDVCLMPFALNEATEYINPTKTLEYMAAKKPIVSTAVTDVIRNFTPIVKVAYSADEFIDAVHKAVAAPDPALLEEGVERAKQMTWDSIVSQMKTLMDEAMEVRAPVSVSPSSLPKVPSVGEAYLSRSAT